MDVFARVINLSSRPDRWARIKSLGIARFDALQGNTDALSLHALCKFKKPRARHEDIVGLGAIGCALSHIQVWREFLESDKSHCLVLEDDIQLVDVSKHIVYGADIHLLGWCGQLHPRWGNVHNDRVVPWPASCGFVGAHAYLITRHAATQLLKTALPLEMQVDYYIQSVAWRDGLVITKGRDKIRQVYTGSDVFTLCFMCEPVYPVAFGVALAVLVFALWKLRPLTK